VPDASGTNLSLTTSHIPVLGAFDFEAAFPSVIHEWVWLVLMHRKIPEDFLRIFKGLYKHASATFKHKGETHTLIRFLSGVLQGCPGSAFLFNNAVDPFLFLFDRILREKNAGIVRACADDIGVSLRRLKHLGLLQPIFAKATHVGGLSLKPPKCVIIPLCELTDSVKDNIKTWLCENISTWADFSILPTAKLLGFFIGPKMGTKNWGEPITKFKQRVQAIRSGNASIALNAYTYNTKVIPVTSYQAQLIPLPRSYAVLERVALHTILRMPWNSLRHADFFQIHCMGGPKLRSMSAACAAALFRTAKKTITSWPAWVTQLDYAAQSFLTIAQWHRGERSTSIWDTPPIAMNLKNASMGFLDDPRWAPGASSLIQELAIKTCNPSCEQYQKMMYSKLMETFFACDIKDQLVIRLTNMFAPYDLDFVNAINLASCINSLKSLRCVDSMRILKTWANGWATSYRMHDPILLPCLFGCVGRPDDLCHYVQCPHLYALCKYLRTDSSENPLIRLGLSQPCTETLQLQCCVYSGYHAIRRTVRSGELVLSDSSDLCNRQIWRLWSVFAEAVAADSSEFSVCYRKFSLPQFISFLVAFR